MKQFLLKLKGSWGKLGNAGNFARQLYGSNPYNLKSGLSFSSRNNNLTWEKSAQTDFGLNLII
jgi:hypothetical protein